MYFSAAFENQRYHILARIIMPVILAMVAFLFSHYCEHTENLSNLFKFMCSKQTIYSTAPNAEREWERRNSGKIHI